MLDSELSLPRTKSSRIGPMLDRAIETSEKLEDTRFTARQEVIKAIRSMEQDMFTATEGVSLRGMPDLLSDGTRHCYGMRVRGKFNEPLPRDGRSVLVINQRGLLCYATRVFTTAVDWRCRPVNDDEILTEDLESYVESIKIALGEHVRRIKKSGEKFERLEEFAKRIQVIYAAKPVS